MPVVFLSPGTGGRRHKDTRAGFQDVPVTGSHSTGTQVRGWTLGPGCLGSDSDSATYWLCNVGQVT